MQKEGSKGKPEGHVFESSQTSLQALPLTPHLQLLTALNQGITCLTCKVGLVGKCLGAEGEGIHVYTCISTCMYGWLLNNMGVRGADPRHSKKIQV